MISNSITQRTVVYSPVGDPLSDGKIETAFELRGQTHPLVLDGHLEDSVSSRLLSPEKAFTNLNQLTALMKDESGDVAKAKQLIADGAETVKVSVGEGPKWTASAGQKPGTLELIDRSAGLAGEQTIRLNGQYVTLETRPDLLSTNESVEHRMVGQFNAATGTITCLREEVERTLDLEALPPMNRQD